VEAFWRHRLTMGGSSLTFTAMIQRRFEVRLVQNVTQSAAGVEPSARSDAMRKGTAQEGGPCIHNFGCN